MITSLLIKDFILVDHTEVMFKSGLNIITGETGAGKSIIINALGQLCGERSSQELVKSGARKAVIEAQLKLEAGPEIVQAAELLDIDGDLPDVIIRKEIYANGNTRIFLNDSPVTLTNLNLLSTLLFDLHGQHQHQRLLHPENHINYLDDFGDLLAIREEYRNLYEAYRSAQKERDRLLSMQSESLRMRDLYRFQKKELEEAELDEQSIEQEKKELNVLSNVEFLHEDGSALAELLYTGEMNASHLLVRAEEHLRRMSRTDSQFRELLENLTAARETIEEIGRFCEHYTSDLEFNPERAEELRARLSHIDFLLKKYQKADVKALIAFLEELDGLLDETENFESRLESREAEIKRLHMELRKKGLELSERRSQCAGTFENAIIKALRELGLKDARFRVSVRPNERPDGEFNHDDLSLAARPDGFDVVSFDVTTNAGEALRPLHKTASGGEISRIMLALKSTLAGRDQTPVLIFDEIDSGISGKIAQIVGRRMAALACYHQILCVTHLPQIAAFADSHFKVIKHTENHHTSVSIQSLEPEQRETEMAHLLGGETISPQALENARQLLLEADSKKNDLFLD
jgi:DNA repair protein RecN (Recombination protein N)